MTIEKIKAFGMTNQIISEELTRLGQSHGIDLGHVPVATAAKDPDYYPQVDAEIRAEAAAMAKFYEVFYSLEKSIRAFVSETLATAEPSGNWWKARVPEQIRQQVQDRIEQEQEAAVTARSTEELDYTNFNDLKTIIHTNWDVFESVFTTKGAVGRVMNTLNTLRNPIAHCSALQEDEQLRLRLAVRDWFRLME